LSSLVSHQTKKQTTRNEQRKKVRKEKKRKKKKKTFGTEGKKIIKLKRSVVPFCF